MADAKHEISPFPALTAAQRLFLEVNGYVVVEDILTSDQVERLRAAIYELREKFLAVEDPKSHKINGCHLDTLEPHSTVLAHMLEADPAFFEYLTHPRIVGLAEELVGGKVRIEESAAIVNRREDEIGPDDPYRFSFHRGGQPGFDSYEYGHLYHCTFVKTLTNLTDLGPDDGGTTVIAGSHKLNCCENDIVAAAYESPSLIHQVEAPAGSTMLMCETLIHATGFNRSNRERVMIIGGYSHPKQQPVANEQPSQPFLDQVPEHLHDLVTGRPLWTWPERHRELGMGPGQYNVPYKARMWSVNH